MGTVFSKAEWIFSLGRRLETEARRGGLDVESWWDSGIRQVDGLEKIPISSITQRIHVSGQTIATSNDLTPNGGLVREFPLFQGILCW